MTPLPPPKRRKAREARVWKGWTYVLISTGKPLVMGGKVIPVGVVRKDVEEAAGEMANEYGPLVVVPVEIREVHTPRRRSR